MNELIQKIEQWANDRNIIKGSKPIDQAMKLFSEFGELADNVGKGRDCRDDIGDVFVVLAIMAKQMGLDIYRAIELSNIPRLDDSKHIIVDLMRDLNNFTRSKNQHVLQMCIEQLSKMCLAQNVLITECLNIAYNDIKDRKGVMSNGVFIKESDPAYASIIASIESNCE
jgi:NTP pyrophosphatase (non-canonical NTP hydrolase)